MEDGNEWRPMVDDSATEFGRTSQVYTVVFDLGMVSLLVDIRSDRRIISFNRIHLRCSSE